MEHKIIEGEALPTTITPKGVATSTMVAGSRPRAIVPTDIEQVWRLATILVKSEMAPRDFQTAEKVTIAVMHGLEIGLPPLMALQRIAIINNRPAIWGDAVPALALATGQVEDWEERIDGEGDTMVATCRVKRKGIKTPATRTFSVADAKLADLWDDRAKVTRRGKSGGTYEADNDSPWYRYPKRMLAMRARVAFRDLFADALGGLYIAEEVITREEPPKAPIDVTPEPVRPDAPPPAQLKGPKTKRGPIKVKLKEGAEPFPEAIEPTNESVERIVAKVVTPEQYKGLVDDGVTPLKMTAEAAAELLHQGDAPKVDAPKGKPLPPVISRKVTQAPVIELKIPPKPSRPGRPDIVAELTAFKVWLVTEMNNCEKIEEVHEVWEEEVQPRMAELREIEQDELLAILDHHQRRFGYRL